MPAYEVVRELVGADAVALREAVERSDGERLLSAFSQRLLHQTAAVSPMLSILAKPPYSRILNYAEIARKLFPIEPMPPGVSAIFDKDIPDAGA